MRKRIVFRQLGRTSSHRMAMLRNMVTSLIKHERIMTTTQKAKELRRVADKMVTHAKRGNLLHRRLAGGFVREKVAMIKLFEILGPRYRERDGGYTRVMKLGRPRRGDSADMSYIEFVDREGELRSARPASGLHIPVSRAKNPSGGVVMDILGQMRSNGKAKRASKKRAKATSVRTVIKKDMSSKRVAAAEANSE